ncbi:cortistatin-like [Phyllostomus hastatus]|uniref:cortistatin-like n=1 Tax=Phyllostomus hastatus TaxID=9423 RepID=UPI001E67F02B|nr:cortistatin-like [Phyllostomus hastatus]
MSRRRVGEEYPPAHRMPPLCLLLLLLPLLPPPPPLLSGATAALPLVEGSLAGHDSHSGHRQEAAEMKKNSLWTFLAQWRHERTSQAGAAPSVGGEARGPSKRRDGPPPQQSTRPDKVPCRNFFWKTFSSCK